MEFSLSKAFIICAMAAGILCFSNPISDFFFDYLANPDDMEKVIAQAWNKTIQAPRDENTKFKAIAIGTNGGIDVIVQGTQLLRKLGTSNDAEAAIKTIDHDVINNLRHLQEVFTYYFTKGAGGERFMNDKDLYDKAVSTSKAMSRAELYIGCNAALMAQTFAELAPKSVGVLFGGLVGPGLTSLLNKRIIVPRSVKSSDDEYHIIMEFAKGEKWAGKVSPIASRFIFSHDITNGQMHALERFIKSLDEFRPDLIVVTGLHMLESQNQAFWKRRLAEIASALETVPNRIPIHMELASMADEAFVKALSERIFPMVDSIGLNEQELWITCQVSGGPHCKVDGKNIELHGPPSPGVSNDILQWILQKFANNKYHKSRFGRIHFHTLTYHTVATQSSSKWLNGKASVAAGARIASTQSCGVHSVHPSKVELRLSKMISLSAGGLSEQITPPSDQRFEYSDPVMTWTTDGIDFHLTPVLVCKEPTKTVGLGDAISSMGLLYAGYKQGL